MCLTHHPRADRNMNLVRLEDRDGLKYALPPTTGGICQASLEIASKVYSSSYVSYVADSYKRAPMDEATALEDFFEMNKFSSEILYDFSSPEAKYVTQQVIDTNFNWSHAVYPRHWYHGLEYDWNLGSSAEEPFRRLNDGLSHQKRDHVVQLFNDQPIHSEYNKIWEHRIKHDSKALETVKIYDININARSHLTTVDDKSKIRAVYGYPFPHLALEAMFYKEFFDILKESDSHIAYGCETLRGGMHVVNGMLTKGRIYICIDWKKWDKSVRISLTKHIFNNVILPQIDLNWYAHQDGYGYRRVKSDLKKAWDRMVWNFCYGPIATPSGERYMRSYSGIPSGSLWTQLLGSFANVFVIYATLLSLGLLHLLENILVLGDDGLLVLHLSDDDSDEFIKRFADEAYKLFGVEINVEKTTVTRNPNKVKFLGYSNNHGSPIRPEEELVAKFLYPERQPNDWPRMKGRSIGLAWASCGAHPRMYQLVSEAHRFTRKEANFADVEYLQRITPGLDLTFVPDVWTSTKMLSTPAYVRVVPQMNIKRMG